MDDIKYNDWLQEYIETWKYYMYYRNTKTGCIVYMDKSMVFIPGEYYTGTELKKIKKES